MTFMENMDNFFDISKGKCLGVCSCSLEDQVSPSWKQFLEDQQGERLIVRFLSSRKLSLRGATAREEEDRKRKSEFDLKFEKREDLLVKK